MDSGKYWNMHETTIAEQNKVSIKELTKNMNPSTPFRIYLPDFFNIPSFEDKPIGNGSAGKSSHPILKEDAFLKKRIKDLTTLAEGMKRAKNIKQQSRFYFTLGVLLHNNQEYEKSIDYFEKFLRIVIVMGDQKSVQLGLNVIGCEYMYMGQFQKATQFHYKQSLASHNPDKFISFANVGFCQQLQEKYEDAYSTYQLLKGELDSIPIQTPELQEREHLFSQLVERTEKKILEKGVFMTQKPALSPSKSLKGSFVKEQSSILMRKKGDRKQYESAKLNYAISAAEENIEEYLKSSFKP